MTVSTENFIKTIYHLNENDEAKTGIIARELQITHAATTDMANKLAKKELIHYEKYKALKLTENGEKYALKIIRKHRLWEMFLYKIFNLSLEEIHIEAELLEHQTSDFLLNKIDEYLNFPQFDPHGDPIPDKFGKLTINENSIKLNEAIENSHYQIVRLNSSETNFCEVCKNNHLKISTNIEVLKNYSSMIELKIDQKIIIIPISISQFIHIKKK